MFISKLTITNVRSHEYTELELKRVNLIRGSNGAGKSTIANAVEWLWTNRVMKLTDKGGRNADLLIRAGAKEMTVACDFHDPEIGPQDGSRLCRVKGKSINGLTLQAPDFETPDKLNAAAEEWIATYIGSRELLSAILNSSRFIEITVDEQKALLISALAAEKVVVPPAIREAMKAAGGMVVNTLESDSDAEQVYKQYFEIRRDANRDIKALGDLEPPEIPADMPSAATVRERISKLRSEKDGLTVKRTMFISQTQREANKARDESLLKLRDDRIKIIGDHDASVKALREATASRATHFPNLLDEVTIETFRKTVEKTAAIEVLDKDIVKLKDDIAAKEKQIAEMERGKGPKTCPTCHRPIEQADITPQIESLKLELEGLRNRMTSLNAKRGQYGDPKQANDKLNTSKAAVVAVANADETIKRLRGLPQNPDVADLDTKIAELSAIPDVKVTPDTSEIDGTIKVLEDRIANGEQILQNVTLLEGKKAQYDLSKAALNTASAKASAADVVVQEMVAGGPIRSGLVGDKFNTFRDSLLECLSSFGFHCKLQLEPYVFTVAEREGGKYFEFVQLCETERFRFGVALQIALAQATGVNFVCVDRSDMLISPELRGQLTQMLMVSTLDQAIIFAATEDRSTPEPMPEGVRFIDIAKVEGKTVVESVL